MYLISLLHTTCALTGLVLLMLLLHSLKRRLWRILRAG